jgi:antitoxin VapB
MALHIKSEQVDLLARKVAKKTGETITEAISVALAERLARLQNQTRDNEEELLRDVRAITARVSSKFRNDKRTARELIDALYDDEGLPV